MDSENDFDNANNNSVNSTDNGTSDIRPANSGTGDSNKTNRGGPKTRGGKLRSSRNAQKEGYFARELPLTEAEQSIVDKIVNGLRRELKPNTTIKRIAFENVVTCIRRCIVASRLEGRRMNALLADEAVQSDEPVLELDSLRWFGSSRADVKNGIRLLLQTESKLRAGAKGDIDREMLSRAFGSRFVSVLEMSLDKATLEDVKIDRLLDAQKRDFGLDRPAMYENPTTVPVDPLVVQAMVLEFVDERKSFLEGVLKLQEQSWIAARLVSNSEFNPRFYASAVKDLQKAFDWFFELVEKGM